MRLSSLMPSPSAVICWYTVLVELVFIHLCIRPQRHVIQQHPHTTNRVASTALKTRRDEIRLLHLPNHFSEMELEGSSTSKFSARSSDNTDRSCKAWVMLPSGAVLWDVNIEFETLYKQFCHDINDVGALLFLWTQPLLNSWITTDCISIKYM